MLLSYLCHSHMTIIKPEPLMENLSLGPNSLEIIQGFDSVCGCVSAQSRWKHSKRCIRKIRKELNTTKMYVCFCASLDSTSCSGLCCPNSTFNNLATFRPVSDVSSDLSVDVGPASFALHKVSTPMLGNDIKSLLCENLVPLMLQYQSESKMQDTHEIYHISRSLNLLKKLKLETWCSDIIEKS